MTCMDRALAGVALLLTGRYDGMEKRLAQSVAKVRRSAPYRPLTAESIPTGEEVGTLT